MQAGIEYLEIWVIVAEAHSDAVSSASNLDGSSIFQATWIAYVKHLFILPSFRSNKHGTERFAGDATDDEENAKWSFGIRSS